MLLHHSDNPLQSSSARVTDHRKLLSVAWCGCCYLPFPPSDPLGPSPPLSLSLPTTQIAGSHYHLRGSKVNPIFQPLLLLFPSPDPFPGVKPSCHLNSHQFTRGEGALSVGNPSSSLPPPPLLSPPPHRQPPLLPPLRPVSVSPFDGRL